MAPGWTGPISLIHHGSGYVFPSLRLKLLPFESVTSLMVVRVLRPSG